MSTRQLNYLIIGLCILFFAGCMDDTWSEQEEFEFASSGVYIINSGNFGSSTSSLSYYDISQKMVYNNVISRTNTIEYWGDVAQSMIIKEGIAYLVINNSGKILLLDSETGKIIGKITGLVSPRYIHFVDHKKAYISDLYARAITIINPQNIITSQNSDTFSQTDDVFLGEINTNNHQDFQQHSTEKFAQWGNKVFVSCWMRDNQVLIIDEYKDEIIDSIKVAAQPNSLMVDKYDKLWVLCDGGYDGSPYAYENPKLYRINAATNNIEDSVVFDLEDNPQELQLNGTKDTLFFLNTHLYQMAVSETKPRQFISSTSEHQGYGRGFYGLGIDPYNSEIYISDAIDNSQAGKVYRFSPTGEPIDTFSVGVNPINFCFK